MLMPKKDRVAIFEYLFKEGVMVAKRDPFCSKHPKVDVPNLHVMKALQSLKSKGFVREQFAWCHFYWYLTNEGIQYLRDYLYLPAEIVPATLKRQTRTEQPRTKPAKPAGDAPSRQGGGSDRQDYRKGPGGGDKKSEVGAGSSNLEFRGGFGRGRGGFGGAASGGQ